MQRKNVENTPILVVEIVSAILEDFDNPFLDRFRRFAFCKFISFV